jgi:outer membrane receptor protein involved in Fe transport
MVYVLYSQGYRPGGANRFRGEPAIAPTWDTDKMTNYETGYKGTLADGSVRISISAFYMDWEDYQFELIDPSTRPCDDGDPDSIAGICGQPYQVNVLNAGDAHIMGTSFEVDWAVTANLIVGVNGELLEAETDTDISIGDTFIPEGTDMPVTPDFTGAAWATYVWPVEAIGGEAYVRLQWSYSGSTTSQLEDVAQTDDQPYPTYTNDSYHIGDLSMGMKGETWEAIIFANNLTDERASYNHQSQGGWSQYNATDGRDHVEGIYTNRPREYGIRIIKRWGG